MESEVGSQSSRDGSSPQYSPPASSTIVAQVIYSSKFGEDWWKIEGGCEQQNTIFFLSLIDMEATVEVARTQLKRL